MNESRSETRSPSVQGARSSAGTRIPNCSGTSPGTDRAPSSDEKSVARHQDRTGSPRPRRVAFISPCGWGNLGDAAIQESFIHGARTRIGPDIEIVGITLNPFDTELRHGVPALPMEARSPGLIRRRKPGRSPDGHGDSKQLEALSVGRRALRTPLLRPLRVGLRAARSVAREALHWVLAFRTLRRCDLLVMSGGGQLDEYWGGPWAAPYSLWKWSFVARLTGTPLFVLSVGAGTIRTTMGRRFFRSILRQARYFSLRDPRSAMIARDLLGNGQEVPVVADLAFGHAANASSTPVLPERTTVAVSPIAFLDPTVWPVKDAEAHASYVECLVDLTKLLVAHGHRVLICVSNSPDRRPARTVYERSDDGSGAVNLVETSSTEELLACFRSSHVAVVSRLHGAILANILRVPTVSISYDWKVDEHARSVGLGEWIVQIGDFDPADVVRLVDEAIERRAELTATLEACCTRLGLEVGQQFDQVFASRKP